MHCSASPDGSRSTSDGAFLAAPPIAARDVQALNDLSAMIRDGCRDPAISGEFPVCLSTVSVPYDSKTVMDGFFFFR